MTQSTLNSMNITPVYVEEELSRVNITFRDSPGFLISLDRNAFTELMEIGSYLLTVSNQVYSEAVTEMIPWTKAREKMELVKNHDHTQFSENLKNTIHEVSGKSVRIDIKNKVVEVHKELVDVSKSTDSCG
jgi:hypothetical protein